MHGGRVMLGEEDAIQRAHAYLKVKRVGDLRASRRRSLRLVSCDSKRAF